MVVHKKVLELKTKAAPINYRNLSVNEFGTLVNTYAEDLANGIVEGYAVRWGVPNEYREVFIKGAFAKSIRENGPGSGANYELKFLYQHSQGDPLSLFEWIKEDEYGLRFRTKPLDKIDTADKALIQLRSGTLNNFSIGFDYIWEQMEYDEKNEWIVMKEARLFEISVVSIPADMGTFTMRNREENVNDLYDDTEDFIDLLPRKLRLQAREIFARHKSLIVVDGPTAPKEQSPITEEPKSGKVQQRKLNLNYLIEKLEQ
jgi:HK97 family phage prohead protease